MALGAGKYDHLCTYVREQAKAMGACVLVLDGEKGWGFSVQAPPAALLQLARVLQDMGASIEQDMIKDLRDLTERN